MEPGIFRFLIKYSWRRQLALVFIAFAAYGPQYYQLELPKIIVNKVLQGNPEDFPTKIYGVEFSQLSTLWLLCGLLLAIILLNQTIKYVNQVFKNLTGERMLRRFRYQLYQAMMRFPQSHFKKTSPGEIIPMVTAEAEPLGGFMGDAFSVPLYQGGVLLTSIYFLFVQSWEMGAAATALYPIQFYLVPKIQAMTNRLGKQRIKVIRRISDRINETANTSVEIHVNDTARYDLSRFSLLLDEIFWIRYRIYALKFLVKFINNTINQLGPLSFYSLGGYLVLQGEMSVGALVAGIAAQKELAGPWKELLDYYQSQADIRIKYQQIVEQFDPPGAVPEPLFISEPPPNSTMAKAIEFRGVSVETEQNVKILDTFAVTIKPGERVAVVGDLSSGRNEVVQLLARIIEPSRGQILVGEQSLNSLPISVTGRYAAYVSNQPGLVSGSLGNSLFYGVKHFPKIEKERSGKELKIYKRKRSEALKAGHFPDDLEADWVGPDILNPVVVGPILELCELREDIYELGLHGPVDPDRQPHLANVVLKARNIFLERAASGPLKKLVEPFDKSKYNRNASLAENVLFGHCLEDIENIIRHPYMDWVLDRIGLTDRMLQIGYTVAETMIELFGQSVSMRSELFERFSFVSAEQLPELEELVKRAKPDQLRQLPSAERYMLRSLPFKLTPTRHRLGVIDPYMEGKILEARGHFAQSLPGELRSRVSFFDRDHVTRGASVIDNILFGKIVFGQAASQAKVGDAIRVLAEEMQIRVELVSNGMVYDVGQNASRLTGAQRQKLGMARALLKNPDLLLAVEALANLEPATTARLIPKVLEAMQGRTVVWSLSRPSHGRFFDRILVLRRGRLVEDGDHATLLAKKGQYTELVTGE